MVGVLATVQLRWLGCELLLVEAHPVAVLRCLAFVQLSHLSRGEFVFALLVVPLRTCLQLAASLRYSDLVVVDG